MSKESWKKAFEHFKKKRGWGEQIEEDTSSDTETGQDRPESSHMDSTLTDETPRPQRRVHEF